MKRMIILSCVILFLAPIVWAQEKCEAPVWNVGDRWTYRSPRGETVTNTVIDVKEDLYFVRIGETEEIFAYNRKNMNVKFRIEGSTGKRLEPNPQRKFLDFPVFVGKEWKDVVIAHGGGPAIKEPVPKDAARYWVSFKVEGIEEISTHAGTFKTYRIYSFQRSERSGRSGWLLRWYCPEIKACVKSEIEESPFWHSWIRDLELISYELK